MARAARQRGLPSWSRRETTMQYDMGITTAAAPVEEQESVDNFNIFDAVLGVLVDPGQTMRMLTVRLPWIIALLVQIGITGLAYVNMLAPDLSGQVELLPYDTMLLLKAFFELMRHPVVILFVLVLAPIGTAFVALVYYGLGTLFGGDGSF